MFLPRAKGYYGGVRVLQRKESNPIPLIVPQTLPRSYQAEAENCAANDRIGLPWWGVILATAAFLCSCNLTPTRPDAIFTVYRDRMKAENIKEARTLLSDDSRKLAITLESTYKLRQPPEDLALLNALDPVSPPVITEKSEKLTLLQVRTMKGGERLIRVARKDSSSPWKIDLTQELTVFQSFLEARRALETVREQAGEFAATWKAFNDRLSKMPEPEPPAVITHPPKPPPKQTKPHNVKKHKKRVERKKPRR